MIATKPHISFRQEVQSPCGRDDATICFVGSAMQFPDTVLRTVQAEIGPAHTRREGSLAALDGPEFLQHHLCAIVVDEQNAEDLVMARAERHSSLGRASTLIAYMHQSFAEDLMQRHAATICSNMISLLPMNLNLDTWLSILRMTLAGGHYIPPELLSPPAPVHQPAHSSAYAAIAGRNEGDGAAATHGLTRRESEVLVMLASGQPNKTIATRLELSEHTVKLHIHRIIAKLGVTNRTEAAVLYLRQQGA